MENLVYFELFYHFWKPFIPSYFAGLSCLLLEFDPDSVLFCNMLRACGLPAVPCQPRSQGLFPGLRAGREKALASAAGHVPILYTLKSWV